ncbi:MAG: glycosyltransferase, partial [Parachlamydiaceae bacterium]|nr:glycosyltransferase [Parachlamydiaceae bacterium]
SELCLLTAQFDPEKLSLENHARSFRYRHPYTVFYNSLLKDNRNQELKIAKLGIDDGVALLSLNKYFSRGTLYGFESNAERFKAFENTCKRDQINLNLVKVQSEGIAQAFHSVGIQYDLIIENSSQKFEEQIRIIENSCKYLKPGGILVIEDLFKKHSEADYLEKLKPILMRFQDCYFISINHQNKRPEGRNNHKLLVLVKKGANPIFKNKKKMTIITPSMRPENLQRVKNSINFDYVDEWIIVYDGSKITKNPYLFKNKENGKIKEYIHTSKGVSGNPQRNFALDHVQNEDTYLYFVDDDNVIHKDLYKLLNILDDEKIYTFDQYNRIKGNSIVLGNIDTAMVLIDYKLCKKIRWTLMEYAADFFYFNECHQQNRHKWIYVHNVLCTYNTLPR